MARPATVTEETVARAADALVAEGEEPSIIAVRARLGGGSYSTVQRHLAYWRGIREAAPAAPEVPAEISAQAEDAVRALWATATAIAQRETQAVRDQALAEATTARRDLADAQAEVERLEVVESELRAALEASQKQTHDLELRAAGLEERAKRVEALEAEIDALRREYADSADLRTSVAEMRAQLATLVATRPPDAPRG